jgi:histidinol-phosphate phosphatase family protein
MLKAVFLDRDGVINRYPGDKAYVTSWRKFSFLPRALAGIRLLTQNNYRIFVASNQAGVGRSIYSQRTLDLITARMLERIERHGGRLTKVYYCIHRKDAGCSCRKPAPGLIKKAAREFGFSLKRCYFVGDTVRDIFTARAAGCKSILVLSGKEKSRNAANWEAKPDYVFRDLLEAAKFIVKNKSKFKIQRLK